jgi:hypothetical protein
MLVAKKIALEIVDELVPVLKRVRKQDTSLFDQARRAANSVSLALPIASRQRANRLPFREYVPSLTFKGTEAPLRRICRAKSPSTRSTTFATSYTSRTIESVSR